MSITEATTRFSFRILVAASQKHAHAKACWLWRRSIASNMNSITKLLIVFWTVLLAPSAAGYMTLQLRNQAFCTVSDGLQEKKKIFVGWINCSQ